MSSSNINNNIAHQKDLQSYGELEKYMYSGRDSVSFFNREIKKCMPFVHSPQEITKSNGTAAFGYSWSLQIDKNFDYLENLWLTFKIPEVRLKENNSQGEHGTIRWTENLLHNIIEDCSLVFNDTIVSKLDNFALDFLAEFLNEESKHPAYLKAIGNIPELTEPGKVLPERTLTIPLPLFFCKDSGNAIPLFALPHTDIKVNFKFQDWKNLLIFENSSGLKANPLVPVEGKDIESIHIDSNSAKLYGTFVTVSNEERQKLEVKNKLMIVEQIQTSPRQRVDKKNAKIDLLFKQSIKSLYFAVRNGTYKNVWSNYNHSQDHFVGGIFQKNSPDNEILTSASIKYGEEYRVAEIPISFFQYINPWYHSTRIPTKGGLCSYSFALDQNNPDPTGGTALSRIDSPTLNVTLNDKVINNSSEIFELIVIAVTNNIMKISEGKVSFPVI